MQYKPRATQNSGDVNLFATILNGSRAGDLGNSSVDPKVIYYNY
ncbi:MAG: hypothetical protein CM15mP102_10000 [Flavobacteriales bacterium]|nr:MAG: hypothetical protein CM15mP102_10000 [Flavobacteriales bacterium]